MKRTKILTAMVALGVLAATASPLLAAQPVQFNNLPAPVQETINEQIGAGGITSIQRTTVNGVPVYEVRRGAGQDQAPFYVSETGSVINLGSIIGSRVGQETTRKGTFNELPVAVQNTVRGEAGNARIDDVDVVTRDRQTIYGVRFLRDGRPVQLVVDSNGKVLSGAPAQALTPAAPAVARVPLSQGTKATFEELPNPVQKTLRTYTQGARIEDIDRGIVQGRPVYEVAFKHKGEHIELRVAEDGSVVRDDVNAQFLARIGRAPSALASADWQSAPARVPLSRGVDVSFRDLPSPVRETVRKYARDARIEDIDRGTVNGRTAYQAAFKHQGEHIELRVAEDGSLVHDQENARFVAMLTRSGTQPAVGAAPSWETLRGGEASPQAPSWAPLGTGQAPGAQLMNARNVPYDQLPNVVQRAVRTRAGGASIDRVVQGSLNGQTVYEVGFIRDGRPVQMRVAADGRVLP